MRRFVEKVRRSASARGFSLVEVMVGALVLVVGMIVLSQLFASGVSRVLDSDIRSVLHQVAAKEVETIRGLHYEDVGTTDGHPQGVLAADENRVEDVVEVHIHREVVFWTDDSYDEAGPYPANYRRVAVTVSAVGHEEVQPVELVTNIAGGATGGSILVRVQDSQGQPVEDATFTIENAFLVPPVNIISSALRTDELGIMLVPGLLIDPDGNYEVEATKTGYSSDSEGNIVVLEASLHEVVLTIDLLSSLNIRVIDDVSLAEVEGMEIQISGPAAYYASVTSQAGGRVVDQLRFATEAEPYIVTLVTGYGYLGNQQNIALPAGESREVVFHVIPGSATTTTVTIPATTTTVAGTTTTLAGTASLLVTVRDDWDYDRIRNAWVNLEGRTGRTNRRGEVLFVGLANDTYDLNVTAQHYEPYSGVVTVSGPSSVTIYLHHD
jgi:hypothetical protein